jgi:hypothetical protein
MKLQKVAVLLCVLVLAVSAVSARQVFPLAVPMAPGAESQAVGGDGCWKAIGLGLALAAGALTPCGVVCASLAWYDLGLVAVYCG